MKKVLVSVIFAFLPLVATLAVPAKPGQWRTLTLADGRQVRAELKGDEFMHFWQTEDSIRRFVRHWLQCHQVPQQALSKTLIKLNPLAHREGISFFGPKHKKERP